MNCLKCSSKAVITLQHGDLCKNHFLNFFEERVFSTINTYQMIRRGDKIAVAVSGGKDSLTVLYLTKKYLNRYNVPAELQALCIDEGIAEYREKTIADLKQFCREQEIKWSIVSFEQELGKTLDEAYPLINKDSKKKPCNICGVWRRYLLNKEARRLGCNKVVTGHNLDDEAQAIIMNWFKDNMEVAPRLGPITGVREEGLFVQRVKPLYFCPEKEVRLYAFLKGFQIKFAECPYSREGYRWEIQEMLNTFEAKYKGTKQGIVKSFLNVLPLLKEGMERKRNERKQKIASLQQCTLCGEASNKDICNACSMKEVLHAVS